MRKAAACAPLALMLAMQPVVSADTIVYDNTATFLGALINGREGEFGDGVTLAGTDRIITRISLMIHALDGDHPADVRVRLFRRGDTWTREPGAMLWESELFRQMTILDGSNLYDFDIPNVRVRDSLTWTLQLTNVAGSEGIVGSRFMHPPVVGSSNSHIWRRNPDGRWTRLSFGSFPSFGARIEAVPEPGTLSLFALCAAVLRWHRRARSRSASSETSKNGDKACPDH